MSPRHLFSATCILSFALALPGCHGRIPKSGPTRESGQSGLMNESFAAKNACNPENHLRPFIIEWDATDRSSFEAYAANDVVVVRYEGCNMTVLEECRNDSVRGEQGAYKPVEWTSGALEKLNISNQGELVAKLPLSVGTLGGRVAGGEKFSMEYFVSGTRTSTRPAVYREDLASNPGCEGATHFVYGINLGAFALGSVTEFVAEASASLYGFGAGGKNERSRTADKQGGDLGTCKGDTAKDVEGCKSPIRLTLRPIREGSNPEKEAMKAPDTEESLNAAGAVNMKLEMSAEANARIDAARQKIVSKDGKGCLAELDAYDKLEPKRKSTDPKTAWTQYRAQCLMLAGKCDPGKELIRKWFENNLAGAAQSPEMIDMSIDFQAQTYCQGKMSPRDEMLKGYTELALSRTSKRKVEECEASYQMVAKHIGKVKPKDEDDHQVISASRDVGAVAAPCFAGAGDCKRAFELYKKHYDMTRFKGVDPKYHDEGIVSAFNATAPKCAPKPAQ